MSNNTDSTVRPAWVPWQGWDVYDTVHERGGYSDARRANTNEQLYCSPALEGVWKKLGALSIRRDAWFRLISVIVTAVECPPENGKRATRDRPSEKVRILVRQKDADEIMGRASNAARELASLLYELAENGGDLPGETYSSLALIESAIDSNKTYRANCQAPFKAFRKGMSSRAKSEFPSTVALVEALARALELQLKKGSDVFADDPWLSSQQSSWIDYVRHLKSELQEFKEMYGEAPEFNDADWTSLAQVFVDKSISRQAVEAAMKEL